MSKRTLWQLVGIVAVVGALYSGLSGLSNGNGVAKTSLSEPTQTGSVIITIEGLYTNRSTLVSSNETVLHILQTLNAENPTVHLETKEYSGLGTLVQRIGDHTNGENDNYWQYKVNGVMPQVGADKLEVKDGDSIEWYFGGSSY